MSTYKPYRPWSFDFPKYGHEAALETLSELLDFTILDTETSGIKAKSSEIVEVSIVDYRSKEALINTLVKPRDMDAYANSKAREIHHIGVEELEKAPTLDQIWPDVLRVIQKKPLVVYNATFDIPLLRSNAMRLGLITPPLSAICAMRLLTAYLDSDVWLSLDEACELFSIRRGVTHRAKDDCLDTIKIIEKIKENAGV